MSEATPPAPLISEIRSAVCVEAGLLPEQLLSASRRREIARPRQVAMYLAREMTRHSYPEIARLLGGRDHTTVIYGVRKIERLRTGDGELDMLVRRSRLRSEEYAAVRRAQFDRASPSEPDPAPEAPDLQLEMFA